MEKVKNACVWTKAAEIELIYKTKVKASERPIIKSSHECYQLFRHQWDDNKLEFVEQFKIALLNNACRVLGIYVVSSGSSTGTIADPKLIFAAALIANAISVILIHNHPSGNLAPSEADKALTRKLVSAGDFLDIKVLDHLIISPEGYYSFADEGLL